MKNTNEIVSMCQKKKAGMEKSTTVQPTLKHRTSAKRFHRSVKRYSIIPQHRESGFLKFEPLIISLYLAFQTNCR